MLNLDSPVTSLKMVGSIYGQRLAKLGIVTIKDLLYHLPFRYDDFSQITAIGSVYADQCVTVKAEVDSFKNIYTKNGKNIQRAQIHDVSGEMDIIWFNQIYLNKLIRPGLKMAFSGKTQFFGNKLVLYAPQFEILRSGESKPPGKSSINVSESIHTGRLVPVYPETEGLTSKWLRSRIHSILTKFSLSPDELLPTVDQSKLNLMPDKEAIRKVHFPDNLSQAQMARERLEFDEILTLSIRTGITKLQNRKIRIPKRLKIRKFLPLILKFIEKLPFTLTRSQKDAVKDILSDLSASTPMNRLLEGDVGSGKTVVAAVIFYAVFLNGRKSILMAPTEILASQHFKTIDNLLRPYHIRVGLLTGAVKSDPKRYDVLIGTHALIARSVKYSKFSFVVIDEQQRFGVDQRSLIRRKARKPHVLSMTATPIPRTIALTIFADLDLSVLDEMPLGGKTVKTWVVPDGKREAAYGWIRKQIKYENKRQQCFIVCPLIEESETLVSVKAVKAEYEHLSKAVFPDLRLALLHGRLKPEIKSKILTDFREGNYDILVSTPVIEVGVDIPDAVIMVVEAAERFGLTQIHQMRGRVGRNDIQSYCLLFTQSNDEAAIARLKNLEIYSSGPKLAEIDLKLRGSGDLFGIKQHGYPVDLKISNLDNLELVSRIKKISEDILRKDPGLIYYPYLKKEIEKYKIKTGITN